MPDFKNPFPFHGLYRSSLEKLQNATGGRTPKPAPKPPVKQKRPVIRTPARQAASIETMSPEQRAQYMKRVKKLYQDRRGP